MRIKLLAFVMIIFCFCGRKSTNEKKDSNSVLIIDLLSEPESGIKKLSEFASNIEYIPLQTAENSLMGSVRHKIEYLDKRIYIENIEGIFKSGILCFNLDGKFLFKIENTGRGPEEYTFINDFDVSPDNKNITILSRNKLLLYGISDTGFTFQRSIALKDPAPGRISMVPETDKTFLAIPPRRGTESTLSLLKNTGGDTIYFKPNCYKYNMVRKINYRAENEMLVYSFGNAVCFKEAFSDTVFYADAKGNSFKPRMIFDSHCTLMTPEVRGGLETSGNHANIIANIFETTRYVFYYYISSGPTPNRYLFDKKTKTRYKLEIDSELESKVKDDLIGGLDFNIEFRDHYCSGGKLFSFVDALALKRYVASEETLKKQS